MPSIKENHDLYAEIENQMHLLRQMQGELRYDVLRTRKKSLLEAAALKIPMLAKLLRKVDNTGEAVVKVGEDVDFFHDSKATESISHGFHFGGVAMAAFDFVRIPLIYLTAFILKEEIPISLNKNARWAYSGIVLGLAITAVAVPVAAPVIAFVLAGLGLVVSSFLLGKILYERYQLNLKSKELKKDLQFELNEMELIQQDAARLENNLGEAREEEHIGVIYQEIAILKERFDTQKELVEVVKSKQLRLNEKIESLRTLTIVNRSVAIFLAGVTISGLVVGVFFPPVGLGIVTGAAIVGLAYVAVRISIPLIRAIHNWIKSKSKPDAEPIAENPATQENSLDNELMHESTADVFKALKKNGPSIKAAEPVNQTNEQITDKLTKNTLQKQRNKKLIVTESIFNHDEHEDDGRVDADGESEGEGRVDVESEHP